jgi:hypothetical protein
LDSIAGKPRKRRPSHLSTFAFGAERRHWKRSESIQRRDRDLARKGLAVRLLDHLVASRLAKTEHACCRTTPLGADGAKGAPEIRPFTGAFQIRVGDIADFNRLHGEQLIALPGVRQTRTFFVMKEVVDNAPLDF